MKHERWIVGGLVVVVVVAAWVVMSRSGEDQDYSASGFDLRGAASIAARAAAAGGGGSEASLKPATSLMKIQRTAGEIPPASKPAETAPASQEPSGPAAVADAKQDAPIQAASAQEAAGWGISLDRLKAGAFKFAWKITDHPKVLKFLLDNKMFNDAVFSQKFAKKVCNDKAFTTQYFMDPNKPGGIQDEMWAVDELLKKPEAAKAAAQSEFARRIMDCPTFESVSHDRDAVVGIARANPHTLMTLANPAALDIIGSNSKAQDTLLVIQNELNAGPGPTAAGAGTAAPR